MGCRKQQQARRPAIFCLKTLHIHAAHPPFYTAHCHYRYYISTSIVFEILFDGLYFEMEGWDRVIFEWLTYYSGFIVLLFFIEKYFWVVVLLLLLLPPCCCWWCVQPKQADEEKTKLWPKISIEARKQELSTDLDWLELSESVREHFGRKKSWNAVGIVRKTLRECTTDKLPQWTWDLSSTLARSEHPRLSVLCPMIVHYQRTTNSPSTHIAKLVKL